MPSSTPNQKPNRFSLSGLTLIQKIGAGYAAMALFTMAALGFSAINIYQSNNTARQIANNDLPVISALIELRTSLLTQEGFARKYAILHDPAFIELFRQREAESLATINLLERTGSGQDYTSLKRHYQEYHTAAQQLFDGSSTETSQLRSSALQLLGEVDANYMKRKDMLQTVLSRANEQQNSTIWWTVAISCTGFLLAIGVAPFVTYRTFGAIRKLQSATHRIAAGDFDYDPQIPVGDEISDLARDFTRMAARLKVLEQMSLDASPLTRLPGNFAIERVLEDRLNDGAPFAFCYADLDNFKPYGDHYGYAKGSDLIRITGDLIYAAVKEHGGPQGFVGHVGGDDFVMVIPTEKIAPVCQTIIERFDNEVVRHYTPQDLKAGGIAGSDRYGVQRFFPVTTISIAVIICGKDQYSSAVDIARAAAKVKDSAKEIPGSNYLVGSPRKIA
ncbi:MAG TPA: diguanylate cyclase [Geobacter sp.]|nr:diguanylate cyclase [Geobacter sp.]